MPAYKQADTSIEEINQRIWNHLTERNWQNNASRSIAISIALEANELLEHYQWSEEPIGGPEAVGDELADIFIYGIQIAQQNNIDIAAAIDRKLAKSAKKYPVADFKDKTEAANHETWIKNKLAHKKEGL